MVGPTFAIGRCLGCGENISCDDRDGNCTRYQAREAPGCLWHQLKGVEFSVELMPLVTLRVAINVKVQSWELLLLRAVKMCVLFVPGW